MMNRSNSRSLWTFITGSLVMLLCLSCAESNSPPDVIPEFPVDFEIAPDPTENITDGQEGEGAPLCGSGGACSPGYTCCPDSRCYNLTNDPANCGECGSSCSPKGNMCIAGNCSCNGAAPCTESGDICCTSGGCLDPNYDPNNCGSCGFRCESGQPCVGGTCGGSCVDVGCPTIPHGTSECRDDVCVIVSCEEGWSDGDGNIANGCECSVTAEDNGGPNCDAAYDLGELHDTEPGESVTTEGFCSTLAPEDWYVFDAIDDLDTSCDNFHVDIRFLSNPGRAYVFDVTQASCSTGTVVCDTDTEYVMAIDTRQGAADAAWGECPCTATATLNNNLCTDNSTPFFVVVRMAEGAEPPGCEPYRLEISNGKYNYSP